jgi:hypothetical protein
MKLPHQVAGVSLAMALAACSGAQNGATPMTLSSGSGGNSGGGITHYSVPAEHQDGIRKAATTALILVANNPTGELGTISEYAETATGNVAPTSVIANHNGGPVAIAFSSKEGIGFANGGITSGGQFGVETFSLAGDFLTGIEGFAKHTATNAVAFDSKGQLFVSASLPEGIRAIEVFARGYNNSRTGGKVRPKRTISDEGGVAIDSNNLLYVANSTTATIDIFPSGSGTMQAQIGGSNTGLVAPGTVAVDASFNVYVFDPKTDTISEFAAGATGNVAPIRTISGSNTGLSDGQGFNLGLAVSKTSGDIFVSNPGSNSIVVFAATARGNVAPIQTIAGSATQLSNPLGIALAE